MYYQADILFFNSEFLFRSAKDLARRFGKVYHMGKKEQM